MIVNIEGVLANSATAIFGNFPFLIASNKNVKFKFDSIEYNCTPLGGELFLLKSLQNKIGLYLALTGGELDLSDLFYFKLIYGYSSFKKETIDRLKQYTDWEPNLKSFELNQENVNNVRFSKRRDIEWSIEEFFERSQKEDPEKVLLDLYYRKNLIDHANITQRMKQNQTYEVNNQYDQKQIEVENNHLRYDRFLQKHLKFQKFNSENSETVQNRVKIFRIFQKKNIDEILEMLETDGSDFAIKTYAILKKRDKNLMQLIVDMFHKAENCTFVECLEIEEQTLLNALKNEQFKKNAFQKNQDLCLDQKLEIGVRDKNFLLKRHRNDLLPIKHYYKEFPEAFLSYLNRTDLQNPYQCDNYMNIVKSNLFRLGVDYMNPTYDRAELQKKLNRFFTQNKNLDLKFQEFHDFINDKDMIKDHLEERSKAIDKLNQIENFEEFLNKKIDQIFRQNQKKQLKLVQKRLKQLNRFELSRNINQIKNFFVKTFLTKPNNKILADQSLFENIRLLDIGSDRYTLSKEFQKKINFEQIKKKYQLTQKVDINQLENYLKNKDVLIERKLEKNENYSAKIDWSKQDQKTDMFITRKRKWKVNIDLADYIYEKGLPTAEQNLRLDMVENLKNTFEKTSRILNDQEQEQFYKHVIDTFFVDFSKFKEHKDLMQFALDNLLTFHKPLIGEKEVNLIEQNNKIKNTKTQKLNLTEEKFETLKKLILFEQHKEENQNNFLLTCNSLQQFLTQSEYLTKDQKYQFSELFEKKSNLLNTFQINCQKEFDLKIVELIDNEELFVKDFQNQANFIQVNYDIEIRNYILPNIFYKNAKVFLNKLQNIFQKIENICQFKNQDEIQKILKKEQIFDQNLSLDQNLKQLDDQMILMISLVHQSKDFLTDKNLIYDRQFDIIQEGLKHLMIQENKIQDLVNYLQDNFFEEDFISLNTSHLNSITTTKEDIKQILEELRSNRRKSLNPVLNDVIDLFQELVNQEKDVYKSKNNEIANNRHKYENNLFELSEQLFHENIIIDYNPFQNLIQFYDKLQNKLAFKGHNTDQNFEISDNFFFLEKQNIGLTGTKILNTTPPTIFQLEKITKRLAHEGSSAMDNYLYKSTLQNISISNQSGEAWVFTEIKKFLKQIFEMRKQLEQKLTENQLINLDLQIAQFLQKNQIIEILQDSFNQYKFIITDLQKKFQEFHVKNSTEKKDKIERIEQFSQISPNQNMDLFKLYFSFVQAMFNNKDYQDFDIQEIHQDFGDMFTNPKKFMRQRKKWSQLKESQIQEDNKQPENNQYTIQQDFSEIYSYASNVLYEKYHQAEYKDLNKNISTVIEKLNKKAEIVLDN